MSSAVGYAYAPRGKRFRLALFGLEVAIVGAIAGVFAGPLVGVVIGGLLWLAVAVRSFRVGLWASPDEVTMTTLWKTRKLVWAEIDEIRVVFVDGEAMWRFALHSGEIVLSDVVPAAPERQRTEVRKLLEFAPGDVRFSPPDSWAAIGESKRPPEKGDDVLVRGVVGWADPQNDQLSVRIEDGPEVQLRLGNLGWIMKPTGASASQPHSVCRRHGRVSAGIRAVQAGDSAGFWATVTAIDSDGRIGLSIVDGSDFRLAPESAVRAVADVMRSSVYA